MTLESHYKPLVITHKTWDEPLHHISTLTQDSLCSITSMEYKVEDHAFTFLLNRFCWELCDSYDALKTYYRVHSAFTIKNVSAVKKKNFRQNDAVRMLNLLYVSFELEENIQSVRFVFSGHIELDVQITECDISLNDYGHPWPTHNKPIHIHEHIESMAM